MLGLRKNRRGAQAIETALVTIFGIVPLLAGVIDYGAYLSQHVQMVNCVKQGARAASLTKLEDDPEGVAQNVAAEAAANAALFVQPTFSASMQPVDFTSVAAVGPDTVIEVVGRAPYNSFFGGLNPAIPDTIVVEATMLLSEVVDEAI